MENQRKHQIDAIEKMYSHLEAKDVELQAQEKKQAQFSTHNLLKFWILGAVVAYFAYIAFTTLDAIYLILAAFVISMVMDAPITYFSKYMGRGWAIGVSYLIILLFLIIISLVVLPFVFNQLAEIIKIGVVQINAFQELLKTQWLESIIQQYVLLPSAIKWYVIQSIHSQSFITSLQWNLQDNISQIVSMGTTYATNLGWFAVTIITGVFSTIAQAAILFLMSVFFSSEKEQVINFVSSLAGSKKNHMYVKLQKMYAKLWLRLKGQLFVCLYVGVMVIILFALGSWIFSIPIPNILTLGVIAWLMNFIPYIWPFIGMIIAILVALVAGWWKAWLLVSVIYIIINQSENNILTPIIMNKTLGVSPLLIFISMFLGGLIFGFIGILLAVPIAVILTMAFDQNEGEVADKERE